MKPVILDLFCGAGGCAKGYERAGFTVYGIDIKPQPNYPYPFLQMDALEALRRLLAGEGLRFSNGVTLYLADVAAFHASPPCQAYIQRNKNLETKHPKLIAPTRERLRNAGLPYVIENVLEEALESPWMLCGTMFGLPLRRHRYFEVNPTPLVLVPRCHHWGTVAGGDFAAVYARGGKGHRHGAGVRDAAPMPAKVTWEEAMGIDWMERGELSQAIPWVYTDYIGKQLMAVL